MATQSTIEWTELTWNPVTGCDKVIRDQCLASNTPFFFKQWGGTNKKKTGRTLDGQIWGEMPKQDRNTNG